MTRTTQELCDEHLAAVQSGDFDRIVSNHAKDCMIVTLDGAFHGKEGAMQFFTGAMGAFPNLVFTWDKVKVEENVILMEWSMDADNATIKEGVMTIVAKDGMIWRHTQFWVPEFK